MYGGVCTRLVRPACFCAVCISVCCYILILIGVSNQVEFDMSEVRASAEGKQRRSLITAPPPTTFSMRKSIATVEVGFRITAVSFGPFGKTMVIGTDAGEVMVVDVGFDGAIHSAVLSVIHTAVLSAPLQGTCQTMQTLYLSGKLLAGSNLMSIGKPKEPKIRSTL